jgi:hypothetical protein
MLPKILVIAITGCVIIHGLIHLVGFRVYAQGAQVDEMSFKTTFLNGALDLGVSGTRTYGLLWLLSALGFITAGIGFLIHSSWWQPVLIATSLVSVVITGMDWGNAFRGTLIDLTLLSAGLLSPLAARLGFAF